MDRKYILKSPIKIARLSRLIAKGIDLLIVMVLVTVLYPIGVILAFIYLACSDSMHYGQSLGKKFIGFSVISLIDGKPCSFKQSLIRNLPILIPLAFIIIPFWGWILAVLIGIPLISLELYLLFTLDSGHRLGDVMADTTVIANDPHRSSANMNKRRDSWFESQHLRSL